MAGVAEIRIGECHWDWRQQAAVRADRALVPDARRRQE